MGNIFSDGIPIPANCISAESPSALGSILSDGSLIPANDVSAESPSQTALGIIISDVPPIHANGVSAESPSLTALGILLPDGISVIPDDGDIDDYWRQCDWYATVSDGVPPRDWCALETFIERVTLCTVGLRWSELHGETPTTKPKVRSLQSGSRRKRPCG